MEDVAQLQSKISAFESENGSLKGVIEQVTAEKNALDQTVMEVLRANIGLKTGCALLENRQQRLTNEIEGLNSVIAGLRDELARALARGES